MSQEAGLVLQGCFPNAEITIRSLDDGVTTWSMIAQNVYYQKPVEMGVINFCVLERVVSDLQARQNGEDVKVDICHKDILADSFLAWVFPDCDEGNELRHGFVASMKG